VHDIGWHYERARERVDELLRPLGAEDWEREVPACPGWRVRDVLAHLVGNTEDAAAGRLGGPPSEAQTWDQVDRHRGDAPLELLDLWAQVSPFVAAAVTEAGMWPAAIDAVTHEHDLRGALGRPGARDHPSILEMADRLAGSLQTPVPVRVLMAETAQEVDVDADPDADPARPDPLRLRASAFEVLRFRLGRRSRRQVEALDWSGDPAPVIDHLFIFGPAPVDIVE
jgi:uncharacterized protein (TIGR03083 family)